DINRITKEDTDGNSVPDEYDCEPENPDEQDFTPIQQGPGDVLMTAAQRFGQKNINKLKKLGEGRDRRVYALGNNKVIKIAKNPGGLTQNTFESNLDYLGLGKEHETGLDYAVVKRNKPLSKQGRKKLSAIRKEIAPLQYASGHPSGVRANIRAHLSNSQSFRDAGLEDSGLLDYEFNSRELFANRQWGENEEGELQLDNAGALDSTNSVSKYRVKDFPANSWQAKEWQKVQTNRRLFKNKGDKPMSKEFKRDMHRQLTNQEQASLIRTTTEPGASKEKQEEWKAKPEVEKDINRITKEDTDGNSVPDEYDCEPENPDEQDVTVYHGTNRESGNAIIKDGFFPNHPNRPVYFGATPESVIKFTGGKKQGFAGKNTTRKNILKTTIKNEDKFLSNSQYWDIINKHRKALGLDPYPLTHDYGFEKMLIKKYGSVDNVDDSQMAKEIKAFGPFQKDAQTEKNALQNMKQQGYRGVRKKGEIISFYPHEDVVNVERLESENSDKQDTLYDSAKSIYHVTQTKSIPSIKKTGVIPHQPSHWIKSGNKTRYGEGEIFAFENKENAAKWAMKMDWEEQKDLGTGKISVVQAEKTGNWQRDTADPLAQANAKGQWLKKRGTIKPEQIQAVAQVSEVYNPEKDVNLRFEPVESKKPQRIYNPQSLYHAGNKLPSNKIRDNGYVWGFRNLGTAEEWKKTHNKEGLYEFQSNDYEINPKLYSRKTPQGAKTLGGEEMRAFNILAEKPLFSPGELKEFDNLDDEFRNKKGYGACPVLAAETFERVGGTIHVGLYHPNANQNALVRHVWVERNGKIYDTNNIDQDEVKHFVRDGNDKRYKQQYIFTSKDQLRDYLVGDKTMISGAQYDRYKEDVDAGPPFKNVDKNNEENNNEENEEE
ncbi:hypothetical protein CMI37_10225, partial [Candidatus Pacearchaeota archaeon]|nr:hypothetical protein [Candidatus Pacearchaeota archaeon]